MSVYVDDMGAQFGRMKMCHMVADTQDELMAMVDRIGVRRKWIQDAGTHREHFDVCMAKRAAAIAAGAIPVTMMQIGRITRAKRDAMHSATPPHAPDRSRDVSGAYTPRSEAERAAVVALVEEAYDAAFAYAEELARLHPPCPHLTVRGDEYAQRQVPPVPTRTRTVPRVVRVALHGRITAITFEGDTFITHHDDGSGGAYPSIGALVLRWRELMPLDDDTIAALLDLKARPTEEITEAVAESVTIVAECNGKHTVRLPLYSCRVCRNAAPVPCFCSCYHNDGDLIAVTPAMLHGLRP